MTPRSKIPLAFLSILVVFFFASGGLRAQDTLPVADLKRETPVHFATEVYPFLKANCLACHNQNKPKADLVLESPQDMIRGGDSGPAILPGNGADSFLFTTAAHLEEPTMPPANNKSKAENLTPDQLALLKLWIDQGAKGDAVSTAAPESWTLLTGPQPIYTAAISGDGRFAAAGRGQRVHLYDLRLGALAATLRDADLEFPASHRDLVQAVAFSPDGETLATAGYRVVKIWKRDPAGTEESVALPAEPSGLALSADGKSTAVGTDDGSILLLGDAPATVKDHAGAVAALAFSPDGTVLYTASADKTAKTRSVAEPAKATNIGLPSPALSLAVINGGKQLLFACADRTLRIVASDLKTPLAFTAPPAPSEGEADGTGPAPSENPAPAKSILEFQPHGEPLVGVAATGADGSEFAAAYADGTVILFRSDPALPGDAPKELRRLAHGSPLSRLAVSPAASADIRIATSGLGGTVILWDPADGKKLLEFPGDPTLPPRLAALRREAVVANRRKAHWNKVAPEAEALWKAESEKAIQAGEELAKARRELSAKQHELKQLEAALPAPAEDELLKAREALAVAERAVSGADRNRELSSKLAGDAFGRQTAAQAGAKESESLVAALDSEIETLEKNASEEAQKIVVKDLAFSADGGFLVQSLGRGTVRLYSLAAGIWIEDIRSAGEIVAAAVAGERLLTVGGDKEFVSRTLPGRNWSLAATLGNGKDDDPFVDRVTALAFHPGGVRLVTGTGVPSRSGRISVWDTATWTQTAANEKAHGDTLTAFAYSPDGSRIASASTDKLVRIFDSETLEVEQTFEGHTSHVLDVAWNADDLSLASASADLKVKVWDLADGRVKSTIDGYEKEIGTVAYVGETESLLTASGDKAVKLANTPLPEAGDSFLHTADASEDGSRIIAGGQDGILRLWDGPAKKLIATFPSPEADEVAVAGK